MAAGAPSLFPFLAWPGSLTLWGHVGFLVPGSTFLPLPHKQPFLLANDPFEGVWK